MLIVAHAIRCAAYAFVIAIIVIVANLVALIISVDIVVRIPVESVKYFKKY